MVQPIDPQTLQAIGGQKTAQAAKQFQQSMASLYSVSADMREREQKRELHARQMELTDLNIAAKEQEALGATAVGVLNMLDTLKSPTNFVEQYRAYRGALDPSVRDKVPEGFNSAGEARMWANQQAAQSNKLLPYLKLRASAAGMKQWEYTASLLAIPENERSSEQQRFLDYYGKTGINIHLDSPGKNELTETTLALKNKNFPGTEQKILDSLDEASRGAFLVAVSNETDLLVEKSRKSKNPISRETARSMAINSQLPYLKKTDSLLQEIPWIGNFVDSEYTYAPNEEVASHIHGKDSSEEVAKPAETQTKQPVVEIHGGYKWDMSTNPPTNLGVAE